MRTEARAARHWIDSLGMSPHPEGGYFLETYRSAEQIPAQGLPVRFGGPRALSTGIFYLLETGDYSTFHRIKADEMLHFYDGGALEVHLLDESGYSSVTLGRDVACGERLQYVVPAGTWFAMAPKQGAPYSLIGCTVSPGFDFADFEMAGAQDVRRLAGLKADSLISAFPPRSPGR